jgi:hypothetical protein
MADCKSAITVIWREDQKPLRFGKKKKNIFGCRSVNAAACEKTPRRSQKGPKKKCGIHHRAVIGIYHPSPDGAISGFVIEIIIM